jgi:teichoic acid transport system permease protein
METGWNDGHEVVRDSAMAVIRGPRRAGHASGPAPQQAPQRGFVAPELKQVGGRPPLREYLRQLFARRHFVWAQAWGQTITKNRGLILGNLWLVLVPLLDACVYMLIFGVLFRSNIPNFASYVIIGLFMFTATSRPLMAANSAVTGNSGLIRGFAFPRAALPMAVLVRETIQTIPILAAMVALVQILPRPHPIHSSALLVPLIFVLQTLFNAGCCLLSARLGSALPDSRHLMGYATRLLMYGSAVMWAVTRFDAVPYLGTAVRHNPLFIAIDMHRQVLMFGTIPPPQQWVELSSWAFGLCVIGAVVFWQGEETYGRPQQ